jgi:D-alanyl-D-alanine carboxypeptidase
MALMDFGAHHGLRYCLLAMVALAAVFTISSDVADARRHHRLHAHYSHNSHATRDAHATRAGHSHRHARVEEDYSPPYASIVVDGNSGAVLQATNPDGPRHPASLTKVMTLYLLFERLDAGRLKLDSPLRVSEHAAEQSPTKLDLKPGQTITVEDAIKGIVTKSANDAAVAVAENLGGDEESFAKLMTQKARALGMAHTTYVNASGLPDDDQITTARDQALLGGAIQERFPNYYKYFSTESFVYRGEAMRNHNHLLGAVEGVDGIKTGFTHASGFNLLTSVHRDGRFIVGVVMGGPTSSERDERMRELIGAHLKEASLRHTTPAIAEGAVRHDEAYANSPMAKSPASRADHTAAADPHIAVVGSNDPIRPVLVKTISFRTAPIQTASLVPMPTLVPTAPPTPQPPLPQLSAAALSAGQSAAAAPAAPSQATASAALHPLTEIASAVPAADVSVAAPQTAPASAPAAPKPHAVSASAPAVPKPQAVATSTVAVPAPAEPPPAKFVESGPAQLQPAQIEPAPAETTADVSAGSAPEQSAAVVSAEATHAHSGWMIQIGAFDDEDEAKQHLSDAQVKARAALAAKDPFTEKVQKGDKALYRARFAGFDKVTAEAACRTLKRSDFACMALKD